MSDLNVSVILQAVDKMTAPVRQITKATKNLGISFDDVEKRYGELSQKTRNLGQEQRQLKQQLGDVTGALREQERRLQKITKLQAPIAETQNKIQANLDRRANLRGQMLDAAALGIAFAVPIKAAIDFESVMADVKKVIDFDTPQQFKNMSKDILLLSQRIPMVPSGIADIVAAAGQAGIARNELARFAEDAAKMGIAFDISGKEAGAAMTGLRSIFKLNQDQVVGLSDSYNYLSNTMDARASDLLEIANRSGSMAKLFGLTGQQLGALGATFKALKTPTEVAGTGINALLLKLSTADTQPKKFKEALESIGWSAQDLKDAISNDAQGALLEFLESVKSSEDVMNTLSDLFGAEYADDVSKLVGGLGIYKDALNKVIDAKEYLGSTEEEYRKRSETTENGITLLINKITSLAISIGSIVLPGVNALVSAVGKVVNGITELSERFPLATKAIVAVTSALVIGKIAAIGFGYAWTFIKGGILGAKLAFQKARLYVTLLNTSLVSTLKNAVPSFIAGMKTAGLAAWNFGKRGAMAAVAGSNAIKRSLITTGAAAVTFAKNPITGTVSGIKKLGLSMFGLASGGVKALIGGIRALTVTMLMNPIGLIAAAIAAAGVVIYKYWDYIKAFASGVVEGFNAAAGPIKEAFKPLQPLFDAIGKVIGWVVDKVKALFTPAQASTEELGKAAEAGRKFGEWLAAALDLALTPLKLLIEGIEWIIGSIGKVVEVANIVGDKVGGAWGAAKSGASSAWNWAFGDDEAPTKQIVKEVERTGNIIPFPEGGRAGTNQQQNNYRPLSAANNTVNVQTHVAPTIIQRPGEDGEALARRVAREVVRENEHQMKVRQRGALYD